MNKHTPGPWNRIKGDRNVYSAAGTVCKNPAILGGGSAAANWEANARLIAAAPDLLDALSEIINDGGKFVMTHETHRKARAAIARARGEA